MPVEYHVGVDNPKNHRAQVRVQIPEVSGPTVDLVLPSWVPGSYLIRDFARNVRDVRAEVTGSGEPLPVRKVDKARWRVETRGVPGVTVRYEVYGHQLSDDGVDLTDEHFLLNPGVCLPYVDGREREPLEVVVHTPPHWKVYTELAEVARSPARFRAKDYDELVDEPIDAGTPVEITVRPAGIPHRILLFGAGGNFEAHRIEEDVARTVEAAIRLMGDSPLQHYTFFYHLLDPGPRAMGGLEHKASTLITLPRTTFRPEEAYRRFLSVTAHEYFHLYNVKRIRPRVLGPFDYTAENYTRLLWAMEGSTDYFAHLILLRASLLPAPKYLEELARRILRYTTTPGRKVRSLEELSFDAWIDLYRPYEESPNQSVSYYVKGDLVTLCLDLEIRHRTENRESVTSVFRALWTEYGKVDRGLEEDELLPVANRATGLDLAPFFARYVAGTTEVDFDRFLGYAGLRLKPLDRAPGREDEPVAGWLGVELEDSGGRARVRSVVEDGPGRRAGLSPGDELVALDGQRTLYADLPKALERFPPGSALDLTVFRRGLLTRVAVETGKAPPERLLIVPVEDASAVARRVHEGWLGVPWEPARKDAGRSGSSP